MVEILGSSVLIVGYGSEGQSAHRYVVKNFPDLKIGIADKQKVLPKLKVEEVYTGEHYLASIQKYDTVIRSPGVPRFLPQLDKYVKEGVQITSATNIFFSVCPGNVIGVTGTKGKSTTSSLIYEILKKKYKDVHLVGNIGNPALDSLDQANKSTLFVI